jgi:23S rRNA (cytosine1962-C5)-methyltransferase
MSRFGGETIRRTGGSASRRSFTLGAAAALTTPTPPNATVDTPPLEQEENEDAIHPLIILRRNVQSKSFRNGNQLVFSKSIHETKATRALQMGDVVKLAIEGDVSKKDKQQLPNVPIGWGVYNPESMYGIRILHHKFLQPTLHNKIQTSPINPLREILRHQFTAALQLRRALNLPNAETDTYRLIHGEGDSLSGLAVDIIARSTVVVMSSAGWCEIHRHLIEQTLHETLPNVDEIVWKTTPSRLKQDGYDTLSGGQQSEDDAAKLSAPLSAPMVVSLENGIQYETYPTAAGQKTGVYCDQRDNRSLVASHSRGKRVLDLCCFTGGFGLVAAKAGAKACLGVDSSAVAIDTCRANARRNKLDSIANFVQADISDFLQSTDQEFDVVVLDPPKLAPSAKQLDKASRKYHALNRDAVRVISNEHGGLLLTCTCSGAMTQAEGGQYFLKTVQSAALACGKQVTLLSVSGAASCHTQSPISYPGGAYLTAALFFVHPTTV